MANLDADPERERRAANRNCGACSHCCRVLRVDELAKPAGKDCVHQRRGAAAIEGGGGCGIHAKRPPVCRGYRCLWLQGGLEEDERPDLTGGIVDLEPTGVGLRLAIREVRAGAFDESPALAAIAERYRSEMPVRITNAEDVMNPDRPYRVLLADGVEQRVAGERVETFRDGVLEAAQRLPWAERWVRRIQIAWRRVRLAQIMKNRRNDV